MSPGIIEQTRSHVSERTKEKAKRPSFYVVVVHNDPITPRSFVVDILKKYFDKGEPEANRIMLLAHNYGVGVVNKYGHDIAESKAKRVNEIVRASGYPLHFSVEKE
jgi:ATP-dependent Clp protease adaptor protein ClpS